MAMPSRSRLLATLLALLLAPLSCAGPETNETAKTPVSTGGTKAEAFLARLDAPSYREREAAKAGLSAMGAEAAEAVSRAFDRRLAAKAFDRGFEALVAVVPFAPSAKAGSRLGGLAGRDDVPLPLRLAALGALRRLHDPASCALLDTLARGEKVHETVRVAAVACLGDFPRSRVACESLVRILSVAPPRQRLEAARCLLSFHGFNISTPFLARFFDRDWRVRVLAVEYVRRRPSAQGLAQLTVTAESDRNLQVSLAARRALRRLGKAR